MKQTWVAYLLWSTPLLGLLGCHHLYLGRYAEAWLWTDTFGFGGLAWALDFFCIPTYVKEANGIELRVDNEKPVHRRLTIPFVLALVWGSFVGSSLLGLARYLDFSSLGASIAAKQWLLSPTIGAFVVANLSRRRCSFLPVFAGGLLAGYIIPSILPCSKPLCAAVGTMVAAAYFSTEPSTLSSPSPRHVRWFAILSICRFLLVLILFASIIATRFSTVHDLENLNSSTLCTGEPFQRFAGGIFGVSKVWIPFLVCRTGLFVSRPKASWSEYESEVLPELSEMLSAQDPDNRKIVNALYAFHKVWISAALDVRRKTATDDEIFALVHQAALETVPEHAEQITRQLRLAYKLVRGIMTELGLGGEAGSLLKWLFLEAQTRNLKPAIYPLIHEWLGEAFTFDDAEKHKDFINLVWKLESYLPARWFLLVQQYVTERIFNFLFTDVDWGLVVFKIEQSPAASTDYLTLKSSVSSVEDPNPTTVYDDEPSQGDHSEL